MTQACEEWWVAGWAACGWEECIRPAGVQKLSFTAALVGVWEGFSGCPAKALEQESSADPV